MKIINNTESSITLNFVSQKATAFFAGKREDVVAGVKRVEIKKGLNNLVLSTSEIEQLEKMPVVKSLVSEGSLRLAESKELEELYKRREKDVRARLARISKVKDEKAEHELKSGDNAEYVKKLEAKIDAQDKTIEKLSEMAEKATQAATKASQAVASVSKKKGGR